MNAKEFWNYYRFNRASSDQRIGQALMNALFEVDKELYRSVSNTPLDCFYTDKPIPCFLRTLRLLPYRVRDEDGSAWYRNNDDTYSLRNGRAVHQYWNLCDVIEQFGIISSIDT